MAMTFPLKTRKTYGYNYGHKTWYTEHHLGQDYFAPIGRKVLAPFDGVIKSTLNGKQGGKTIWFKPDNDNVIMRFMHLSEFKVQAGEKVKEGRVIALTGNTGEATTAPHLHIDISKKAVNLANWKNFIDPEKYPWEEEKPNEATKAPKPTENPTETLVAPQNELPTQESTLNPQPGTNNSTLNPQNGISGSVILTSEPKSWMEKLCDIIFNFFQIK